MSQPTHLEIAGVRFVVRPPADCPFTDPGLLYRSFVVTEPVPAAVVRVELDATLDTMPDTSRMERVFDAQSWTLFRDGAGYCLSQAPRGPGLPPTWLARLDASFSRGTVFCDSFLVRGEDGVRKVVNPVLRRLDQLLAMYVLATQGGVLIHSTGVIVGDRAYVLAGRSGAGKSTIARLFRARGESPDRVLLSDDRMVVRTGGGGLRAYGTPWAGDAEIALNRSAPLAAILFLHHGPSDEIRRITAQAAAEQLLPMVSFAWHDPMRVEAVMATCDELASGVPAYELHFRPEDSAVEAVLSFAKERGERA
jgi:hypothetical protein